MTHSSRFNYKAKANANKKAFVEKANEVKDDLVESSFLIGEQLKSITEIQEKTLELAGVSQMCTTLLDEVRDCGQITFEEISEPIDDKLRGLPVKTILMRVNQVMQLLGQRVEAMSEELNVYSNLLTGLTAQAEITGRVSQDIRRSLAETHIVGPRPTSAELKQAQEAITDGEQWTRYDINIPGEEDNDSDTDDDLQANGKI